MNRSNFHYRIRNIVMSLFKTSLALTILACLSAVADARTWTDITGRKLEADFVRVTSDDKLVLQDANQELIIPLNRFIEADRDHVKKLLLVKPAPLPSSKKLPSKSLSGRKSSTRTLTEKRVWTSIEGDSVSAKFLRIHETRVVLMQGSRPKPIEFYELSDFDQEFLRKELDALGRSAEIPEKSIVLDSSSGSSSSGNPGTSSTTMSPPSSRSPSYSPGPSYSGPSYSGPSIPTYRPPGSSLRPPGSPFRPPSSSYSPPSSRSRPSARTYTPPSFGPPSSSTSNNSGNSSNSNQSFSSIPGLPPSSDNQVARNNPSSYKPRFSKPKLPQFETPKLDTENARNCSQCNGVLPNHISAGDHCPHCNAYFALPGESQSSPSSNNSSSGWDTSDIQMSGRAIRVLIFIGVAVVGGFIGFCRWLFRQN